MKDAKPTDRPWTRACFQVYGNDKSRIAHTGMGQLPPYRSNESEANAVLITYAVNAHDDLVKALEAAERIAKEALPKFNWGASALNAEAIQALNEGLLTIERTRAVLNKAIKDAKEGRR